MARAANKKTNKTKKYEKFELEYSVHVSKNLLYNFLSTPSGLSEWFADDVNIRYDEYTFVWNGSEQKAKLVAKKENSFVRFSWLDEPEYTYFEFRIEVDDITSDIALVITDFAEDKEAIEAATLLWNSQVETLMHTIGA